MKRWRVCKRGGSWTVTPPEGCLCADPFNHCRQSAPLTTYTHALQYIERQERR